jgi:hypothetical protein
VSRPYRKDRVLTPATVLMGIVVVAFVIFCAATRWGLDLYGPWLAHTLGWTK